ncbi:MAG: alpha/beta hydrolase [Cyclobacteriaceae bacterium]|nr:alpha/beta hydrolase [Cyclobacteriaceae bacterium]
MASLYFKEEGKGPNLIFIHGFCETHEIWKDFVKHFTSSFRVITLDLPGFGSSTIPDGPFSIDDVAKTLANTLLSNNILDSIVIGHSLGGYVALSLAENHPALVKGLCLFHSSSFADTPDKKENRNKVIEFVNSHGVQPFIDTFVPALFADKSNSAIKDVYKIASETKQETLVKYTRAMRDRLDRNAFWTKNDIPKLLIAGEEDTSIPIQISREMAKIGRNLKVLELKNVAHMGFFEASKECEEEIKRFTYGILP